MKKHKQRTKANEKLTNQEMRNIAIKLITFLCTIDPKEMEYNSSISRCVWDLFMPTTETSKLSLEGGSKIACENKLLSYYKCHYRDRDRSNQWLNAKDAVDSFIQNFDQPATNKNQIKTHERNWLVDLNEYKDFQRISDFEQLLTTLQTITTVLTKDIANLSGKLQNITVLISEDNYDIKRQINVRQDELFFISFQLHELEIIIRNLIILFRAPWVDNNDFIRDQFKQIIPYRYYTVPATSGGDVLDHLFSIVILKESKTQVGEFNNELAQLDGQMQQLKINFDEMLQQLMDQKKSIVNPQQHGLSQQQTVMQTQQSPSNQSLLSEQSQDVEEQISQPFTPLPSQIESHVIITMVNTMPPKDRFMKEEDMNDVLNGLTKHLVELKHCNIKFQKLLTPFIQQHLKEAEVSCLKLYRHNYDKVVETLNKYHRYFVVKPMHSDWDNCISLTVNIFQNEVKSDILKSIVDNIQHEESIFGTKRGQWIALIATVCAAFIALVGVLLTITLNLTLKKN